MTDQISLDAHGFESALEILRREQAVCVPTERERRLYRWFNISVYSMAAVFVLLLMAPMIGESGPMRMVYGFLALVAGALMLGTIVLFFLNWGLIRKLYRHAQLRKRLRLTDYFASAFSAERKTTVVGNVISMLTFIAGWLLILSSLLVGAVTIAIEEIRAAGMGWVALTGAIYLVMFLVGVSFVSFRYMQRGKQRLEVVLRLQKTLTEQAGRGDEAKEVKLSPEEYHAIAALERQHIMRDRADSIASARKQADAPGYLCQSSRAMHLAKSKLPPELLVKVERTIAELLVDPPTAAAARGPQTKTSTTPVAGTGLRIEYDVDPQRHLVRLYDLRTERGASVSAVGGADGLS
jgi:hypothetical protein